jgi:hypothetical protein
MTFISYLAHPGKNLLERPDRPTNLINGTPLCAENLILERHYSSLKTLKEFSNVCALPMGNVPHMPKDRQALGIGNPKKLFLCQAINFSKRIRIPKTLSVKKMSNLFPFRHDIFPFQS